MPHQRKRIYQETLLKRMKLWPVIGVLGARQVGKSTLLRNLIAPQIKAKYVTMDSKTDRDRAMRAPEAFTEIDETFKTLIIDEVQKVSDLFDSIKLHVDQKRIPGRYIISGSTEFSKYTGIRESLTGRIGIIHIYPMILSEVFSDHFSQPFIKKQKSVSKITLSEFEKKISKGGMPGICFLRDEDEFDSAVRGWLETTCYRDLQEVGSGDFDGGLALEILAAIASEEDPILPKIAKKAKKDARVVSRYLTAFESLFIIHKIKAHSAGVGKPQYLLCDSGIAGYLGAATDRQIQIHLLNEALASFEKEGIQRPQVEYYRNQKTAKIPLIFRWINKRNNPESIAVKFVDSEIVSGHELNSLKQFQAKNDSEYRMLIFSQTKESYTEGGVEVYPMRG